jgi:hypothetical protein
MELSLAEASPTLLRAALEDHGVVLLRGAIPTERIAIYRNALDEVLARYEAGDVAFRAFDPIEVAQLETGDVPPMIFRGLSGLTIEDYFATPTFRRLINRTLVNARSTLGSFISVSANLERSISGVPMHTDGIIQGTNKAVVAFWSPLHQCGVAAPGLRLLPASRQQVVRYLQEKFPTRSIPGWSSATEWNETDAFNISALEREFGSVWVPAFDPGDVVIFTNWTIHGSFVTPQMDSRRSAAILRWESYRWKKPSLADLVGDALDIMRWPHRRSRRLGA